MYYNLIFLPTKIFYTLLCILIFAKLNKHAIIMHIKYKKGDFKMGIFTKNKETNSVINNLKYDKKYQLYEGTTSIDFFNEDCDVTIKGATIEYAEKCVNFLNKEMSDELFDELIKYLCQYCNFFVENYPEGNAVPFGMYDRDVLDYVSAVTINISSPKTDTIGFVITGECAWNIESGFAIVINDNEIKYVGENEKTYDPWDKYNNICPYDEY